MLSLPPADGYGPAGNSGAGIRAPTPWCSWWTSSTPSAPNAGGQTDATVQTPPAGGPQVAGALGGPATVTVPAGTAEPTAPVVTVLATGTGAPVALGFGPCPVLRGHLDRGERRDHLDD